MVEQNKDNVLLERGTFRIRGNENIRAGMFVRLRRGGFSAEYYVVTVEHEYVPFSGFFSTLTVERGMGFVERAKRGGGADSPYLADMPETQRVSYALGAGGRYPPGGLFRLSGRSAGGGVGKEG